MMRKHSSFIIILALMAAARFAILFLSQTHVHNDESVMGLMGKHIMEGRHYPFYMYGQPYNAAAAWESYLAVIPFSIFGVGVLPMKGGMVVLSLVCLVLFYMMAVRLCDSKTALLATIAFALFPSLLKWHFQVRGYMPYFLSLPILTMLFLSVDSSPQPNRWRIFIFALASGLSLWSLELILTMEAAFWGLLLIRRKLSLQNLIIAAVGFIIGYAPAIIFNLTHHLANWRWVFLKKTNHGAWHSLLNLATIRDILFQEMPKFFGTDTILWYYPETTAVGWLFYSVTLMAVAVAAFPFLKSPAKIFQAAGTPSNASGENRDLLMLVLTLACFVPYAVAQVRTPSYFFGGCFFLAILIGRLLGRCFSAATASIQIFGAVVLLAILGGGVSTMVDLGRTNQIETLTMTRPDKILRMSRIPGADIDAVENHLRQDHITSVWTTVSFIYPLTFESDESLIVSGSIFGFTNRIYPQDVTWREPRPADKAAYVMEAHSPFRSDAEARCIKATGVAPRITDCGTLIVIEEQ